MESTDKLQESKKYEIRVVVANGHTSWAVCWVTVEPCEIYCGLSSPAWDVKTSYHGSGAFHTKYKNVDLSQYEVPAVMSISGTWRKMPLREGLGRSEDLVSFILLTDKESLDQSFKPFRTKKSYDGVVTIDMRHFPNNYITIKMLVTGPRLDFFFTSDPVPEPPGFRSIFRLPNCKIGIDVGAIPLRNDTKAEEK